MKGAKEKTKFPAASLKAYGLRISIPTNESPEDLYKWMLEQVVMGDKVKNTKMTPGYLKTVDGKKVSGELQLKTINGVLETLVIKGADKKKVKYDRNDVSAYGLLMKVSDLTKGGEKVYNDQAKNFQKGSVTLASGTKKTGVVAFQKAIPLNPNKPNGGSMYKGLYFAESNDSYVTSFSSSELKSITQGEQAYYPYKDGYLSSSVSGADYTDDTKVFQKGTIVLVGG
ncbi:MAG: hypothetical protein AB8B61_01580 [Cyclobacteriaceae bacterium]